MEIRHVGGIRTEAARSAAPAPPAGPRDTFQHSAAPEPDLSQAARQAARVLLEPSKETREREILFRFQADESVTAEPTPLADGSMYVSSCDRHLYRVDPKGQKEWDFWTGALVYCEPAVGADGTVYVGNNDGTLYAVSPKGEELWKKETHGAIRARVALDGDGRVYLRGDDDRLRCLAPKDGKELWKQDAPASISLKSSPTVTPTGEVLVGTEDGVVRAYDPAGQELWSRTVGQGPVPPPAVADDGTLYVGTAEGRLVSLSPDGQVRWTRELSPVPFEVAPFVGRDGKVYLHDTRDHLFAVDSAGQTAWHREFDTERLSRQPAVDAAGRVYVNVDNELWRLDGQGQTEWKFAADPGDELWSSPVLRDDGSLVIGGKEGKVYAVKPIDLQFAEQKERLEKGQVPVEQPGRIDEEDGWIRIGGIRLPVRELAGDSRPSQG